AMLSQVVNPVIYQSGYGEDEPDEPPPQDPVTYITGSELRDTSLSCDYLIVTHEDFFSTAALDEFANYRAEYNNLSIVIAKVDDIYTQFSGPGTRYRDRNNSQDGAIKMFVRHAYYNWGIQYLLIVGDVEYVPSHYQVQVHRWGEVIDYEEWYTCVSGEDEWPDLAMGRFSVKDQNHLRSIHGKILSYEHPDDYNWRALYVEGNGMSPDQGIIDLLRNVGFDVTELYTNGGNDRQDLINAINLGQNFVHWHGHGSTDAWACIGFLKCDIARLNNFSSYPIIFAESCSTADLD
ncbi:unnamed protein product, partial [marine sediment metagenome]